MGTNTWRKFSENMIERPCTKCGKVKSIKEFYFSKHSNYKIGCVCKECNKRKSREYHKAHKPQYKQYLLKKIFNLSQAQHKNMKQAQKGLCAICGLRELSRDLSVDHNHITKKVRGLLCSKCNQALGLFGVDRFGVLNLQMAIKYLTENR